MNQEEEDGDDTDGVFAGNGVAGRGACADIDGDGDRLELLEVTPAMCRDAHNFIMAMARAYAENRSDVADQCEAFLDYG